MHGIIRLPMNARRPAALLVAVLALALLTPGCVTRRTVTEGGKVIESKYVVKRPFQRDDR